MTRWLACLLLGCFLALPAWARQDDPRLDSLFTALKGAPSDAAAARIEREIRIIWFTSGSDTIDLLMHGAAQAIGRHDIVKARALLDVVVKLAPDYAEGWNLSGGMAFLVGNDKKARTDLEHALALEPRQFDALMSLARVLEREGDDLDAFSTLLQAQAIDPHAAGLAEWVRILTLKVKGQSI